MQSQDKKTPYARILILLLLLGVLAATITLDTGEHVRRWFDYQHNLAHTPESRKIDPSLDAEARAPVAPSPWKEAEKKRYAALLSRAKPDAVVLPYQIPTGKDQLGVDLSARMVMAYMTAQRLALDSKLKVADVELAALATGETRHMTREDAVAFARSVGASSVVYGLAWHDGKGHLSIRVVRAATAPGTADRVATAERIAISDALTPELAFRNVVDGLMRDIGITGTPAARRYVVPDHYFPEDPVGATAGEGDNPVAGVWAQQLVGSLHAAETFRGKARVYERALAGLDFVDPGSPDYRLLTARALVQLERRPAALEVIGPARTPEETAFVHYLNGNAPDLTAAIEKIKRPLPKLMARIDLEQMGKAYGFDAAENLEMTERYAKSVPTGWQPAVVWHMALRNRWVVRSSMELKQVLDVQYPVQGYGIEEVLRGKTASAPADNPRLAYDLEGLALEHTRRVIDQYGVEWCCAAAAWRPRPFQYLGLLAALSEGMLLHAVERANNVHGLPDQALSMIEMLGETALQGGHPQLQHRTMAVLSNLMGRERAPAARTARAHRLYEVSRQVRQWETADSAVTLNAIYYEHEAARIRFADRHGSAGYPEINPFEADFPPTHFMLRNSGPYKLALHLNADIDVIRRTCAYAVFGMRSCFAWRSALEATGRPGDARTLDAELGIKRFRGNEYLVRHVIHARLAEDDVDAARAFAAQAIASTPRRSRVYLDLGALYLHTGDVDAARKLFLSYPAFSESAQANSVTISNDAWWVASAFANRGYIQDARHFYAIGARQENGSNAQFHALTQLAFLDRRFGDAADTALRAAQRYPGSESAFHYASLLFVLGDSKTAWPVLREAMGRHPGFTAWYAAPTGFRLERADTKAVAAWAAEAARLPAIEGRGADETGVNAFLVALQTLAVDRTPESIDALESIRRDVLPNRKPQSAFTAEAAQKHDGQGSWLDYIDRLAAGYTAHKRNDFEAAWHAFQSFPAPGRSISATDTFSSAFPYQAYAAARTGRSAAFSAYLDRYAKPVSYTPLDQPPAFISRFDISLGRAVLAAAAGNHEEAKKLLLRAKVYGQPKGARPLVPAYVFAEICELLAADSGRREYAELGASFSKAYQAIEPWSAWAYAYEALHGADEGERAKAYAIARYLDPRSARLARVEPAIAKKADEWLASNQPFPNVRTTQSRKNL